VSTCIRGMRLFLLPAGFTSEYILYVHGTYIKLLVSAYPTSLRPHRVSASHSSSITAAKAAVMEPTLLTELGMLQGVRLGTFWLLSLGAPPSLAEGYLRLALAAPTSPYKGRLGIMVYCPWRSICEAKGVRRGKDWTYR
jgi:hypothetical protein